MYTSLMGQEASLENHVDFHYRNEKKMFKNTIFVVPQKLVLANIGGFEGYVYQSLIIQSWFQ